MPGQEHHAITELAVGLLPAWQQALLAAERDRLIRDYCTLPDQYFDVAGGGHERAKPYHFETDGIQFHYLPDTPIVPLYRYYTVDPEARQLRLLLPYRNEHWRHAFRGMAYYAAKSTAAFAAGQVGEACAFAGCLLHLLQDYGFGAHALEGPYGTDIFVLDRLFPEAENPEAEPLSILCAAPPPPAPAEVQGWTPCLLGAEPEEIALHLYTRHVRVTGAARRLCHQIVTASRAGQAPAATDLFRGMYRNVVHLCADTLYTLIAAGQGRFDSGREHLERVALSDLEPIQRPWVVSAPYRFQALVRDRALDWQRHRIPLRLRFAPNGPAVEYAKGFGMGSHVEFTVAYEVPRGLYRRLTCALGLHADFCERGNVNLALIVDGRCRFEAQFDRRHPAAELSVDQPEGLVEFRVRGAAGHAGAENNVVWAAPVLERKPW